jgi:hypothetical protein
VADKRFKIVATALTTKADLVYTWADAPADALTLAKGIERTGAKNVRVLDGADGAYYELGAFARVHKLA